MSESVNKQAVAGGVAGGVGGALSGAAIGASISGPLAPVGGAIGALIGGVGGAITSKKQAELRENEVKRVEKREDNARTRSMLDSYMAGLDPRTAGQEISPASSSSVPLVDTPNYAETLQSGAQQVMAYKNAREQLDLQERLNRIGAAKDFCLNGANTANNQLLQVGQQINDKQNALLTWETDVDSHSEKGSVTTMFLRETLDRDVAACSDSMSDLDSSLSQIGTSLETLAKDTKQTNKGVSVTADSNFSLNPLKMVTLHASANAQLSQNKTLERARKAVNSSNLSSEQKKEISHKIDSVVENLKKVQNFSQKYSEKMTGGSSEIKQVDNQSAIDLLLQIDELKSESKDLKNKLTPEYIGRKFVELLNLKY